MLVSFRSLVRLTSMSSDARVLADDHALVHLGAGRDEQRAALLQVEHGVSGGRTGPVGDQRPGRAHPHFA